MKKTAAASGVVPGNPFQGRMPKQWLSVSNLITLAAVFVFYMMLAMAFGIDFGFGCILAATGAAIIAWTYADTALARKPDTGPGQSYVPHDAHQSLNVQP